MVLVAKTLRNNYDNKKNVTKVMSEVDADKLLELETIAI